MSGRTLEELDGVVWREPEWDLGKRCNALRKKPLVQFTPGDLRLLLNQNESLEILVPMAIAILERDPMVDGEFYPGDLLLAVLRVNPPFWVEQPALAARLLTIADGVDAIVRQVTPMATGGTEHQLITYIDAFRETCGRQ